MTLIFCGTERSPNSSICLRGRFNARRGQLTVIISIVFLFAWIAGWRGQTTLRRYSDGVRPADLRNAAVNELESLKPISRPISVTERFSVARRTFARSMRRLV